MWMRILIVILLLICQFGNVDIGWAKKSDVRIAMLLWRGETEAERGFRDGLKKLGYAAKIDVFNAGQKKSRVGEILRQQLKIKKYDVVYTFGTTVSMQAKSYLNGRVPHVFNIVADPVGAGLVESLDASGGNLSGIKSGVPLRLQIQNAHQLLKFKRLGYIFNSREKNSNLSLDILEGLSREFGFEVVKFRSPPVLERLSKNLHKIVNGTVQIDAMYVPSDSYIVSNAKTIAATLRIAEIPGVGAIKKYISEGMLMGSVADYYELGQLAASIVDQHRKGVRLKDIPIKTPASPKLLVNAATMSSLELNLPKRYLKKAVLLSR